MTNDAEAWIRELRDVEAIKRLKARYFRAVDTKDAGAFRELFTEDATFEAQGLVRRGRDEIVARSSLVQPGLSTVHHGHTPEIDLTGPETARGIWAMVDDITFPPDGDHRIHLRGYGHYHEEYEKQNGRWYIAKLVLMRLRVDVVDESLEAEREYKSRPADWWQSGEPRSQGRPKP